MTTRALLSGPGRVPRRLPLALLGGLVLLVALPGGGSRVAWAAGAARLPPGGAREPAVVDLLVGLLAGGTTPDRVVAALIALTKLGDPRSIEVVALYAGHRRPEIRLEAVRALGALNEPRAVTALLDRLGDDAPEVRAAAADALAARQEPRALPRLLGLVGRNDLGAAVPLGRLATTETILALRERQGSVADGVLATALGAYVKRADVGDGTRVDVLRTIGDLRGSEAATALQEYVASVPARENRRSKQEAERIIEDREARK